MVGGGGGGDQNSYTACVETNHVKIFTQHCHFRIHRNMYFSTQFELATTIYTHNCGERGRKLCIFIAVQNGLVFSTFHHIHSAAHIVHVYCGVYC